MRPELAPDNRTESGPRHKPSKYTVAVGLGFQFRCQMQASDRRTPQSRPSTRHCHSTGPPRNWRVVAAPFRVTHGTSSRPLTTSHVGNLQALAGAPDPSGYKPNRARCRSIGYLYHAPHSSVPKARYCRGNVHHAVVCMRKRPGSCVRRPVVPPCVKVSPSHTARSSESSLGRRFG